MPRIVRSFFIATLIALHSALTLGGSGLHAVPGMGHGSELRVPSRNDHSHGPGRSSHDLTEDCPVCHFLDGESLRAEGSAHAVDWLATPAGPPTPVPVYLLPTQSLTCVRGPPERS